MGGAYVRGGNGSSGRKGEAVPEGQRGGNGTTPGVDGFRPEGKRSWCGAQRSTGNVVLSRPALELVSGEHGEAEEGEGRMLQL